MLTRHLLLTLRTLQSVVESARHYCLRIYLDIPHLCGKVLQFVVLTPHSTIADPAKTDVSDCSLNDCWERRKYAVQINDLRCVLGHSAASSFVSPANGEVIDWVG